MGRSAFVTGGTGFIGTNLIKKLVEEHWDVTVLHRPVSDLSVIQDQPLRFAQGSITDRDSLLGALPEGTDFVFHLAGSTNLWSRNNAHQNKVNIRGTENMIAASARNNVRRFIHTSSVAAWGEQVGEITEETPQRGNRSRVNYEYSKWAGERKALEGLARGLEVVVLNPASVIGPHDKNNWGKLFFALRDQALPAIIDGSIHIAHVDDIIKAHLAATRKARSGHRYILGGEHCSLYDFVKTIARFVNVDTLPKKVPLPLFKLYARGAEWFSYLTGNKPNVTPELVKILTRNDMQYSSQKARNELDYRITPMEISVRDCYNWLLAENLI